MSGPDRTGRGVRTPRSRSEALRSGLALEYFTVAWNVVEALVALTAGLLAQSIALVGFGLDSLIEMVSGLALIGRLRSEVRGAPRMVIARREARAERIVGATLVALAVYVATEAIRKLVAGEAPDVSRIGLALATVSLVLMPIMAYRKRRVAEEIQSAALRADAVETAVCSYFSFTLVAGLGLHWALGWWWADPAAALAMVPLVLWEGAEALRGDRCAHEVADALPDGRASAGESFVTAIQDCGCLAVPDSVRAALRAEPGDPLRVSVDVASPDEPCLQGSCAGGQGRK